MGNKIFMGEKPLSLKWFASWGAITLGSIILAASIVIFITPYNIVPGGVYGIGILLHNYFPDIMVGTFGISMEIPLMVVAFIALGSGVGARTIYSATITPLIMNLITKFVGDSPESIFNGMMNLSDDILLAALFGGAGMGLGVGLIFANKATSGGTDIISMIISKYTNVPLSKAIIMVESTIVIASVIIFGEWKLPLYSIIAIFILTKVMDYVIEGVSTDKLLYIISDKHDELKNFIIKDMGRGGTYIKAEGMYTRNQKNIIFLVVDRKQLPIIRTQIKLVDSNAFMVVVDARETLGDGFKPFEIN